MFLSVHCFYSKTNLCIIDDLPMVVQFAAKKAEELALAAQLVKG